MRGLIRKNLLIAYAEDFASYLLSERYLENYEIRNIILYGSVARGDFKKDSDIDVFVDVDTDERLKGYVKNTIKNFYDSLWFKKWKRLGIKNPISCLVGRIEEWKDLERSIISNSIVLYGSYKPQIKGKVMSLFSIEGVKPESKRVFTNRKLFGYKRYGKKYLGLVEIYKGEKIGRGCFLVPIESSQKILQFLRKNKINVKIREVAYL